jgi:hypothetical protein
LFEEICLRIARLKIRQDLLQKSDQGFAIRFRHGSIHGGEQFVRDLLERFAQRLPFSGKSDAGDAVILGTGNAFDVAVLLDSLQHAGDRGFSAADAGHNVFDRDRFILPKKKCKDSTVRGNDADDAMFGKFAFDQQIGRFTNPGNLVDNAIQVFARRGLFLK